MAIDENREDFEPALWELKPEIDLEQVWFAGVHTDVGGGYEDRSLGDFAGKWLVDEATQFALVFEAHFIKDLKPDHSGTQHNEYKGLYRIIRNSSNRNLSDVKQPVLHRSVYKRWKDKNVKDKSPALSQLLDSVGGDWSKIRLVGK